MMVTMIEIKKSIVEKLKPLGKVIPSDVRSGFEKPAFFVQFMPLGDVLGVNMNTVTLMINIHYFPKEKTELENLKMLDRLRGVFLNTLKCNDRVFTLSSRDFDIIDNVLQFKFTIRYTEESINENDEQYESPSELHINF